MNFLAGVNRVLRANGIIRGDDDDVTTFSDVQHNATLNIAIIAIQDELMEIASDKLISAEYTTGTIVTVSGTTTYSLATDFVQFFGVAKFVTGSRFIVEYPGGLERLEIDNINFDTQTGSPNWWYFLHGAGQRVSFYPTPNLVETMTYRYEKDVSVTYGSDVLPFNREIEAQAFCTAAGRRFKFMFEDAQNVDMVLLGDPAYQGAKGRLARLMTGKNPSKRYGYQYA